MHNIASNFTRLIALMLLVVMTMSMVSCDISSVIEGLIGGEHTHNFVNGKCECGEIIPPHQHNYVDGRCECGAKDPSHKPDHQHSYVDGKCECGEIRTITVAEALAICEQYTDVAPEKYYIRATVKTIVNASYGEMYIEDESGEIYVFGVRGTDWTTYFDKLSERPVKGDEVLLHCQLGQHNGKKEVKLAALIEFKHTEVDIGDLSAYESMTIAAAREAETGKLVKVSGVVAQFTFATGKVPSGVILVDGSSSIYVYDRDLAGQVSIGNTVEIAASKAYWILDDEVNNANKYGYKGSNQLENVVLISNDNGNTDFDKSWISETTVKEIMDTPITTDITSKIFKVTALIKKVPGQNYVNYYFNDIDGVTGTYAYTQCNGSDFAWLDQFDGKFCTVYILALNAKSTAAGCNWRFIPVAVSDDGYTFDTNKAAEYAVKYHGVDQFLDKYTGDPAFELISSVSSQLLNFEGASLTYSSSDENVVYFATEDGKTVMHCKSTGTATVTVTGSYNGIVYSETVEVKVEIADTEIDSITVNQAINVENNTTVTVKGIVGPSTVNQVGFYLIDETGAIPVKVSAELMATLEIGYEVIITGTRTITKDGGGQICIDNTTVVANNYGSHSYSTESFIKDATIDDIKAITDSASATTGVYVVTALVAKTSTQQGSYTNVTFNVGGLLLYTGKATQYSWLESFFAEGETSATLTVELALCDWNAKGLKGCVLAVVNADGTKVLNTLNFDAN